MIYKRVSDGLKSLWLQSLKQTLSAAQEDWKRSRVPSPGPSPCIFKPGLRTSLCCCTALSGSQQCLCSLDKPAEPEMLRDPWRAAAYQAPAPPKPPPPSSSSRQPKTQSDLATKAAVVGRPRLKFPSASRRLCGGGWWCKDQAAS